MSWNRTTGTMMSTYVTDEDAMQCIMEVANMQMCQKSQESLPRSAINWIGKAIASSVGLSADIQVLQILASSINNLLLIASSLEIRQSWDWSEYGTGENH